ncbi:hypothetical protein ERC79_18720 [Rhodococcus sp. ABRD24]|uniref:carboxymuconolactone decarboxylase family protein n=1 Tax=Rhodococcus sp. ABRD24 TaxID=2507582 RepID=UPI001039FA3F|nr:carboxymuconolactone decarboxylase family protein [Rhodococcus sp. ABRD24]QBJ97744.1 hypothetical protein ERC79_18720 [Rhodococcus sp. ABRD24]
MTQSTDLPITPLEFDELTPESQDLLRPRYERLGYLGDVFAILGNNDGALRSFVGFADSSAAPVDQNVREIVALAVAAATNAEPELFQHEHRALRLSFTREEIAAVESLDPHHPDLPAGAAAVQVVSAAAARGEWEQARESLARLSAEAGADQAAGVLLQIGYYIMATSIGHVLGLAAPVKSIFTDSPDE